MMNLQRSESPDEYLKAVQQLRQFLSESDSSDHLIVHSGSNKGERSYFQKDEMSEKSTSARKSLFRSPVQQKNQILALNSEYFLMGLIQRQFLYIRAVEKELSFYRKEIPGIINETKVLITSEESSRMEQANNVAHRLFSLIDTVSNSTKTSHESCEMQRKKLLADLASAQQLNHNLNQQLSDHVCWNSSSQINPTAGKLDDFSRERAELVGTVNKLRSTVSSLQQREADALLQVQQSVEVAEQAQLERAQMESEVHRLVSIVEQHEQQITSLSADHSRRLQDERARWEAKLSEQAGSLKREKDLRDEALTRLSLDFEHLQRNEGILKNEIQLKSNLLDSSRQDYQRQIAQIQNEQNRLAGQNAELQRRLGESELRYELNCKTAEQETTSVRTECEFLRRKIDLMEKEFESRKHEFEETIKELETRNMEMHVAANHRENERAQAVKSSSQSSSLVKYLEQRELALLRSLQDERKTHAEKFEALSNLVDEQRSIIQKLRDQYAALIEEFQKCVSTSLSN